MCVKSEHQLPVAYSKETLQAVDCVCLVFFFYNNRFNECTLTTKSAHKHTQREIKIHITGML